MARLVIDGYGQLELNNAAFRRDGRIEAQCKLYNPAATDSDKTTGFGVNGGATYAENGMLLAVDRTKRIVKLPTATETLPIALNYSAEHLYDERAMGLKNFKLGVDDFYPRLGYLSQGDLFTTNCLSGTDLEELTQATIQATPYYGGISTTGEIAVSTDEPTYGPVLKVVEVTTMPDGQFALKFQVQ